MDMSSITIIKGLLLFSYVLAAFSFLEFYVFRYRKKIGDNKESMANFMIWIINRPVRYFITSGVTLGTFLFIQKFALFSIPVNIWTVALTIVVADFMYYWSHRVSHVIRGLWTYHSVHHSSPEFNLSTAIRLPFYGAFTNALFYLPMILLGFDPITVLASKIVGLLYQYWVHTEHIPKLGWFDTVFNSPSNHRVHHGRNRQYIDKNFGGIFIVWDQMFGSYQAEEEKVVYGIYPAINTSNPLKISFYELIHLVKDVVRVDSWKNKVLFLVRGPGWSPK